MIGIQRCIIIIIGGCFSQIDCCVEFYLRGILVSELLCVLAVNEKRESKRGFCSPDGSKLLPPNIIITHETNIHIFIRVSQMFFSNLRKKIIFSSTTGVLYGMKGWFVGVLVGKLRVF